MDLYLDLKYLGFISHRLSGFVSRGDHKFACRCPICGDSSRNKSKKRGGFFPHNGSMVFHCFNCGAHMYFSKFLEEIDSILYSEYRLEKYRDSATPKEKPLEAPKNNTEEKLSSPKRLIDSLMDRLDTLDDDNPAVAYCLKRKIPRDKFSQLYYVDNVKHLEQLSPKYRDKILGKESRLVLPFYDWKGQLSGITARALGDESLRYILMKIKDDETMIFGTETVNLNKRVYVVEGPIDSLFLPNCIAVAGTGFTKLDTLNVRKNSTTVIIDNQPRNSEVCKIYNKFIKNGWSVVIWPPNLPGKDINDLVDSGYTQDQLVDLINTNTYTGLSAEVAFNQWKKI